MTIETIQKRALGKADFLITCDELDCRSCLDAGDRTFQQAVNFLRARGWRIRNVFGTWFHTCPNHEAHP